MMIGSAQYLTAVTVELIDGNDTVVATIELRLLIKSIPNVFQTIRDNADRLASESKAAAAITGRAEAGTSALKRTYGQVQSEVDFMSSLGDALQALTKMADSVADVSLSNSLSGINISLYEIGTSDPKNFLEHLIICVQGT